MENKKDFVVRLFYQSEHGRVSRWFMNAREAQDEIISLQKAGVSVSAKRFTREEFDELAYRGRLNCDDDI